MVATDLGVEEVVFHETKSMMLTHKKNRYKNGFNTREWSLPLDETDSNQLIYDYMVRMAE